MGDQDVNQARQSAPVAADRIVDRRQVSALEALRVNTIREEALSRFAHDYPDAFWHWLDGGAERMTSTDELEVSELPSTSPRVGQPQYRLCLEQARRDLASDPDWPRPPATKCLCCGRPFAETGYPRWIRTADIGVALVVNSLAHVSVPQEADREVRQLFDQESLSAIVWRRAGRVTTAMIDSATRAFRECRWPWICTDCVREGVQTGFHPETKNCSDLVLDNGVVRSLAGSSVGSSDF